MIAGRVPRGESGGVGQGSGEGSHITDVLERAGAPTHGDSQARLRSLSDALPHGMAYQVHVSADRKIRRFSFVGDNCPRLNGGVTVEAALADSEALYSLIAPEHRRRLHEAETDALETPRCVRPGGAVRAAVR